MPWSVGDVEEHKEGLSKEQKERWVKIANSVLKDCLEEKKNPSDEQRSKCEAKAIRTANSKVGDSSNGKE